MCRSQQNTSVHFSTHQNLSVHISTNRFSVCLMGMPIPGSRAIRCNKYSKVKMTIIFRYCTKPVVVRLHVFWCKMNHAENTYEFALCTRLFHCSFGPRRAIAPPFLPCARHAPSCSCDSSVGTRRGVMPYSPRAFAPPSYFAEASASSPRGPRCGAGQPSG